MKVFSLDEVEERWERVRTLLTTAQIPAAEFALFEAEQPVLLEEARKKGQELFDDSNKIVAPLIFTWTLMKEGNGGKMGRITAAHLDRARAETNALDVIYEEEAEARADEAMFEWAARFPQTGIMEWFAREFSEEGLEGQVELTPVNSVEAFDWLGTCLLAMCYEIGHNATSI